MIDLTQLGKILQDKAKIVNDVFENVPESEKEMFKKQLEENGYYEAEKQLEKAMQQLSVDLNKFRGKL
jgi:hypothetical protein